MEEDERSFMGCVSAFFALAVKIIVATTFGYLATASVFEGISRYLNDQMKLAQIFISMGFVSYTLSAYTIFVSTKIAGRNS